MASWWGYAEADPTVVGILVGTVALIAIAFVVKRLVGDASDGGDTRRAKGKRSRGDGWRS